MSDELKIDIRVCDAYGYCAELLPEIVDLDEWGYPIVAGEITPDLLAAARAAVAACPRVALRIEPSRRLTVIR